MANTRGGTIDSKATEPRENVVLVASSDLQVMTWLFHMHTGYLHKKIKRKKSDYTRDDPKTWPLFTPSVENQNIISSTLETCPHWTLPVRVAYTVNFMDMFDDLCLDRPVEGREVHCSSRFRDYPFNFTETGERRKHQQLSEVDYDTWMRNFGDLEALREHNAARYQKNAAPQTPKPGKDTPAIAENPKTATKAATKPQNTTPVAIPSSKASACSKKDSNHTSAVTHSPALPSDAAFEDVMNTLRDSNIVSLDEVIELKKQLQNTKEELKICKEELKTYKEDHTKNAALLTASRAKVEKLGRQLETACSETRAVKQDLENKNNRIDVLGKEKQSAESTARECEKKLLEERKMRERAQEQIHIIKAQMDQFKAPKGGLKRTLPNDDDKNSITSVEPGHAKRPRSIGASGAPANVSLKGESPSPM